MASKKLISGIGAPALVLAALLGPALVIYTMMGTGGVSGHSFVDCEDKVPTIEDLSVERTDDREDFTVTWSHADGCVDEIVIGRIETWLAIEFDNGEVGYDTDDNLRGTATSATFDLSPWEHLEPVRGLFEVYLYPENLEYGGESYIHEFTIDEVE